MPDVCRQYDCFWRNNALSESWRPDRIGIVATEAGSVTVGHRLLPVVLLQEDFAGASRGGGARELLDHFLRQGVAVMIIHGGSPDRVRSNALCGIPAAEIEAALRYELSQDAEELKRLGAVSDEYRPSAARRRKPPAGRRREA